MPSILLPLALVLAPQIALAVIHSGVPVLAPAIVAAIGLPPEGTGLIGGLVGFGSVWLFAANAAVTPVLGPLRALIAACMLAVCGGLLILTGSRLAVLAGAVAIGFAYAITAPAGSQILSRHTPRARWGTLFSIRQSGVPVGGAIAGLVGASLAAGFGWRAGIAALALLPLGCALLLVFAPARFDAGGSGARFRLRAVFDPGNAMRPFRLLRAEPGLRAITFASIGFAIGQGSVFSFLTTYLTDGIGLSLALAGSIYATAQLSSFAGRILAGMVADRAGTLRGLLIGMSLASPTALLLLSQFGAAWPVWLLFAAAALIGISVATWNGLFLAEIARIAPEPAVSEATASATFFTFIAYMCAPPLFGALVWFGGYGFAYAASAAMVLVLSLGPLLRASDG